MTDMTSPVPKVYRHTHRAANVRPVNVAGRHHHYEVVDVMTDRVIHTVTIDRDDWRKSYGEAIGFAFGYNTAYSEIAHEIGAAWQAEIDGIESEVLYG